MTPRYFLPCVQLDCFDKATPARIGRDLEVKESDGSDWIHLGTALILLGLVSVQRARCGNEKPAAPLDELFKRWQREEESIMLG
ncbi:hypothetical protein NQZ68_026806 [Dissostichus eleginoides]|nr:hypothetical protein NQZ68_026806 [Dissostichus eleginoides]